MAIISNPKENFCKYHFIFCSNDIVLRASWKSAEEDNKILSEDFLPDFSDVKKFLERQVISDWFNEPQLDYTALSLEQDAPLPKDFIFIPLRQFFWMTKADPEKHQFIPSKLSGLASRAHSLLELRNTYRFCPSCGGKLLDDKNFTAKKCAICNRQLFPRIEPAVIVLVTKGDEILLVKNKAHAKGIYSCVAGFIEAGENAEQCVEREVLEETGIRVKNIKYAGTQSWPFPDQLMIAFTAEYKSGEIKIQESELEDAKWFKKDCLPNLPNPGSVAYNLITSCK